MHKIIKDLLKLQNKFCNRENLAENQQKNWQKCSKICKKKLSKLTKKRWIISKNLENFFNYAKKMIKMCKSGKSVSKFVKKELITMKIYVGNANKS